MATTTKAKKKVAKPKAAPRASIAEKEPTALHEGFVEYIKNETGYDADLKSVQLATVLRMDYQRSDENQARLAANKEARAAADQERADKRAAREKKAADKAAAKKSTPAKKATAGKAPAKKAAKKAPAKKAPARRKSTAKSGGEESFD